MLATPGMATPLYPRPLLTKWSVSEWQGRLSVNVGRQEQENHMKLKTLINLSQHNPFISETGPIIAKSTEKLRNT